MRTVRDSDRADDSGSVTLTPSGGGVSGSVIVTINITDTTPAPATRTLSVTAPGDRTIRTNALGEAHGRPIDLRATYTAMGLSGSPSWRWTVVSGPTPYGVSASFSAQTARINGSSEATDGDVSVLRVTVTQDGLTATDTVRITWDVDPASALPDASAPTVTISGMPAPGGEVASHTTRTLTAAVSGGTYDTISYRWNLGEGDGRVSSTTAASTRWTAPEVTSRSLVVFTVTVTVRGTGTKAATGTSDFAISATSAWVRNAQ